METDPPSSAAAGPGGTGGGGAPPPPATDDAAAASSSPPPAAAAAAGSKTIDEHLAQTIHTLDQLTTLFGFPPHLAQLAIEECGPDDVTKCYNWILDFHGDEVEDGGGPVVPRADCPHVERHVRIDVEELRRRLDGGCLMTSECQFYDRNNGCGGMRKRPSRKRLRSEDLASNVGAGTGRLKCEEDYDDYNNTAEDNGGEEGSSSKPPPKCPPGENWLCLHCGTLLCSRYANGHARRHYEDTKDDAAAELAAAEAAAVALEDACIGKAAVVYDGHGGLITTAEGEGGLGTRRAASGHCIAVSLADLSVWCYECDAYLTHPTLDGITRQLEELKFGNSDETKKEGEEKEGEGGAMTKSEGEAMEMDGPTESTGEGTMEEQGGADVDATTGGGNEEDAMGSGSKRKGTPRKLPPELLGTTMPTHDVQQNGPGGKSGEDDDDGRPNSSNGHLAGNDSSSSALEDGKRAAGDGDGDDGASSSSDDDEHDHQAALIASLLQSEHGAALRAYLARHESFDTSDMGQCVPMHLPKPPAFPAEMADFLKSPMCQSIVVLAGAGMSVSSGIPDFRSAGVGLYDTLRPELLTATEVERTLIEDDPTLALDKGLFLQNPLPMLETKRSFILGTQERRWKATLAHRFVELLHTKLGKLTRLYTQNIDGLEAQTSLPSDKVVCVHGSMGSAACEVCGASADFEGFCDNVRSNIKDITGQDPDAPAESTPIHCEACGHPAMKPTIVLFRGSMPKEFHVRTAEDLPGCDLLIIMGTSLTVAPANSLVYRVPPTALRMVINNERIGRRLGIDYGENAIRDVFAEGHSDATCLELADKMGWLEDLAGMADELPKSSARLLRDRLAAQREEKDESS